MFRIPAVYKNTPRLVAQVFWAIHLEEVRPYSGRWMVNPDKKFVKRLLATGIAFLDVLISFHTKDCIGNKKQKNLKKNIY